jgi:hypothetical protein
MPMQNGIFSGNDFYVNLTSQKIYASGIGISSSSFQLVVSGLTFTPSIIIITETSATDRISVYLSAASGLQTMNTTLKSGASQWTGVFTSVSGTGFILGTLNANVEYKWIAFE